MSDHYRRYLDDFYQAFVVQHDAKAVAQLYSQDATIWDPSLPEPLRGRQAVEEWHAAMLRAFPDMSLEFTNVFGAGDYVAAEIVGRGTHTGPLAGPQGEIPPTGKRIEVRGCFVGRITPDGQCAEDRSYFDYASMMQQLGLM